MSDSVSAVLLAIGTELSSGQVINSNSAWLAARLSEAGCENLLHWTLPDERQLISEALDAAAAQSRLIIVTGGLGPTSDDFTRDNISEWLERPLQFHTPSWERIEARAKAYGFELVESQKQQCYFPVGAEVFTNPAGTADGFAVVKDGLTIVALPGPPHEIHALWESSVADYLKPLMPERVPVVLHRWQCLGIPEGSLGEVVEAALADEQGLITGYRAHVPYIEVKLWVPGDRDPGPVLQKLEEAISPWIVLRGDEDAASRFLAALPGHVQIHDAVTGGMLATRLQGAVKTSAATVPNISLTTAWPVSLEPEAVKRMLEGLNLAEAELGLVIGGVSDKRWSLGLRLGSLMRNEIFELTFSGPPERNARSICERALMTWWEWLHEKA